MQAATTCADFKIDTESERQTLASAIRILSIDAVQQANSGHPGMPMGMADIAEVLWNDFLRHNPINPNWPDRDRFILSNGHGSMLQYALLHLSGYDLPIEQLINFRQHHSRTPGHPENGITPGVETTTGPLGQGIANAVGMALAEKMLAERFNRENHRIVDHYTYVFVGDGCLMEGISHEVCSLAGTWQLGKLIVFYDDNDISIDGNVDGWFTDDTTQRFESYGWEVIAIDGHDAAAIKDAISRARQQKHRSSLIRCKTVIGYGSPNKAGSHDCHGAPLGKEEIAATRSQLNWPHAPFVIPEEIYQAFDATQKGQQAEAQWLASFAAYRRDYPELADEFKRCQQGTLPEGWGDHADKVIEQTALQNKSIATRKASQMVLNGFAPVLPELIGGSADLTGSNNTNWKDSKAITQKDASGNYLHYGVREFGMAAIMNGMALHGGFIPYGGTFLVFSDYARNALRMAALTGAHSIFVFSHDSIGLGEDGPTHQPVEHLAALRHMPNLPVWRPCNATETAVAWRAAIERKQGPSCLILSRQNLVQQTRDNAMIANIQRGAYILADSGGDGEPELILIATGSEVELAMQAYTQLSEQGRRIRVVSMPGCEVFDSQDAGYRERVLPSAVRKRIAIEAGVSDYWRKYVGLDGAVIGIDCFGESAPAAALFEHFGFTVEKLMASARQLLD